MDSLCKQYTWDIRNRRDVPRNRLERRKYISSTLATLPLFEAHWMQIGWIANNFYLFQALYHGHPQFRQLVLFNTETRQITEIWPYNVKDFIIDMNNQTVVLLFESENDPNLPSSGVYRVSTNGDNKKISDQMFYWLRGSSQIIGEGLKGGVETAYHITSDNSIVPIGPALSAHNDVSVSPDEKWFFYWRFLRGRSTIYSLQQYLSTRKILDVR